MKTTLPGFRAHPLTSGRRIGALLMPLLLSAAAAAQDPTGAQPAEWRLVIDGDVVDFPFEVRAPVDSAESIGGELLDWYSAEGYYSARVDSIRVQPAPGPAVHLFVQSGPRTVIGDIHVSGAKTFVPDALLGSMDTREGQVLRPEVLERDISRLLKRYEARGFVLASIEIVRVADEDLDGALDVVIHVDEGPFLELGAIELPGARRTRPAFIANVLGLETGAPLDRYDAEEFARRLRETGLFVEVDSIRLAVSAEERAVVRIWLREDVPGSFDAVVGYLPDAASGGGGSVVGNVNILLRHIFGAGRAFDFKFHRLPQSTSRVSVRASDPFAFGLPVRIGAGFDGFQQDSTYDSRRYSLEGGLRLAEGLEVFATGSRELTRPGSARELEVPSSDSWFAGVGFKYVRIDRRVNPRQGYEVTSNVESGRKRRDRAQLSPRDLADEVIRQQRFSVSGRAFVPVALRHVAVVGTDARGIQSPSYDFSDLIRFGGAQSLRGYNEEQFQGDVVARLLTEWRYLLDRTSHLFVFFDLGYYGAPETGTSSNVANRFDEFLAGYGFGLELGTGAGQFSVSLGFNRDEGLDAKVHLGMSLGL
ncbi:MAG TPA: POTRA domain-containing protein [Rhodothermia bacterium]|nr:POTRA domain-containing protein [Rhodothermia bacterium]